MSKITAAIEKTTQVELTGINNPVKVNLPKFFLSVYFANKTSGEIKAYFEPANATEPTTIPMDIPINGTQKLGSPEKQILTANALFLAGNNGEIVKIGYAIQRLIDLETGV